jgi:hypothetical protein
MAMLRPLGLALILPLFVSACVGDAPPQRPLMSPLSEAKTFGYAEKTLAADQIEITYLAARRFVSVVHSDRQAEIARARALAEDLALWRAAQVAIARKARAFSVLNRRSDTNVALREHIYGYGGFGYGPYRYRHRHRYRRYGFYGGYPYDPFPIAGPSALAQVQATVTIALLARMRKGAFDARATAARLRAKYPGAMRAPGK